MFLEVWPGHPQQNPQGLGRGLNVPFCHFTSWEKYFSKLSKKWYLELLGIMRDTPTTRHPLHKAHKTPQDMWPWELLRTFSSGCMKALGDTQNSLSGFRGGDISPCSFSYVFVLCHAGRSTPASWRPWTLTCCLGIETPTPPGLWPGVKSAASLATTLSGKRSMMLYVHVRFVMRRRESGTWWVNEGQV